MQKNAKLRKIEINWPGTTILKKVFRAKKSKKEQNREKSRQIETNRDKLRQIETNWDKLCIIMKNDAKLRKIMRALYWFFCHSLSLFVCFLFISFQLNLYFCILHGFLCRNQSIQIHLGLKGLQFSELRKRKKIGMHLDKFK